MCNIELSHWYKVDKVFYTPEAKLRCVKITSYITQLRFVMYDVHTPRSEAKLCMYIIHNEAKLSYV